MAPRTTTGRVWPLVATFLLASAAASPLLTLLQKALGLDPDVLRLTTLSTAVGALAVLPVWRSLPQPPVLHRGLGRPLGQGVLAAAAAMGLLLALASPAGGRWPVLDTATLPVSLVVALALQVVGAAAEEVGWRGVVQPLMETRMRALSAWVVTGLLFGAGHAYVLAAGVPVFAAFLVGAVALSVLLGALTTGHGLVARVTIATVVHWLVNVGLLVLFSDGDVSLEWTALTAVALAVVATPFALRGRRQPAPAAQ